jgi:hypothetical protein
MEQKNNSKKVIYIILAVLAVVMVELIFVVVYLTRSVTTLKTQFENHIEEEQSYLEQIQDIVEKANEKISKTSASTDNASDVAVTDTEIEAAIDAAEVETAVAVSADITFEDIAGEYIHEWGSGGWHESFSIDTSGAFDGGYIGYTLGDYTATYYDCPYSGRLSRLTKIDDYTYETKLVELNYEYDDEVGEMGDDFYTIHCSGESFFNCPNDKVFRIYLPGTPISEFTDTELSWIYTSAGEQSDTLDSITIVDVCQESASCN